MIADYQRKDLRIGSGIVGKGYPLMQIGIMVFLEPSGSKVVPNTMGR